MVLILMVGIMLLQLLIEPKYLYVYLGLRVHGNYTVLLGIPCFLKHFGPPLVLPLTFDVIVKYVNYLILWRQVKVAPVKSYLSAVVKSIQCEFG